MPSAKFSYLAYMVNHLRLLAFTGFLFSFTSCFFPKKEERKIDAGKNRSELMKADREFSALSESKGMKAAFLEYIDSNGVLLRPDKLPIIGADAVDYLISINDTSYTMTWEPKQAVIAASGDLGYTYGIYEMKPLSQDTLLYGTYVNIWKLDEAGKWKFVLGSGNDGIGDE